MGLVVNSIHMYPLSRRKTHVGAPWTPGRLHEHRSMLPLHAGDAALRLDATTSETLVVQPAKNIHLAAILFTDCLSVQICLFFGFGMGQTGYPG